MITVERPSNSSAWRTTP